jgi:hypothetical protein
MDLVVLASSYAESSGGMVDQDSNCRWLTLDARVVTKHQRDVGGYRQVQAQSNLNLPDHLPFMFNIFLLLAARNRISTPNDNNELRIDPPADKSDAPGSTQYVPVVHHATHRCLTPTRKINSGETITRRISWRDNEHVPPSALPLVLLSFIHRRAWLSLCLLEGYQGMTRLRGMKKARESERGRGDSISSFGTRYRFPIYHLRISRRCRPLYY